MSNGDDNERGWFDEWVEDNWEDPYSWKTDRYDEYHNFGNHGEDGSIWGHVVERFDSVTEANEFARELSSGRLDVREYLVDEAHDSSPGRLASVRVLVSEDGESWEVFIEAYVDYRE